MSAATLQRIPTMVLGAMAGLGVVLVTLAPQVNAADTTVSMIDDSFQPASITINVGDTVTWVNNEDRPHTATADDGSFDSGTLELNGQFSHTFTTAGTFTYFCEFHGGAGGQGMSGTVIVQEAAAPVATPAATVQPTAAPAAQQSAGATAAPATAVPNAAVERPSSLWMAGVLLLVAASVSYLVINPLPIRRAR